MRCVCSELWHVRARELVPGQMFVVVSLVINFRASEIFDNFALQRGSSCFQINVSLKLQHGRQECESSCRKSVVLLAVWWRRDPM